MRSFLLLPTALSLALATASQAKSTVQAVKYGRAESTFVEAREVDAALDVLRRANYNFEDHLAKRDDSWSWKAEGSICYCRPAHASEPKKHTPKPKHHGAKPTTTHPSPGNHMPAQSSPATSTGDDGGDDDCDDEAPPADTGDNTPPANNDGNNPSEPSHPSHPSQPSKPSHPSKPTHPSKPSTTPTPPDTGKDGCPSGYKSAKRGDVLVYNDNDLIDLKDLSISLNILSFSKADATPAKTTKPASSSPKCEDEQCCYKPDTDKNQCPRGYKSANRGDVLVYNDNDLIDAKDISISLNILSFTKPDAFPATSSAPAKGAKCDEEFCCYKPEKGSNSDKCPSGYKKASRGDVLVYNDNDLIDAKNLDISLSILSFSAPSASPSKSSKSVKSSPKCEDEYCCYKPDKGSNSDKCPSGYKKASRGDVLVYNDNDLVDLKNLDISLSILSFSAPSASPSKSSKSAKSSPKCEDEYCCYKADEGKKSHQCPSGYTQASRGDVLVANDNDLIDAKDISISLNILSFSAPSASPTKSSKSAKSSPKCEDEYCCYKTEKGSKDDGKGKDETCPAGYTSYSRGDTIVKSDNDLVDVKDLTISLNILSFPKPGATPNKSTKSPKDKPVCEDETCCVKQTSKKGDTEVSNDDDLVDASGAKISLCILAFCR